MTRREELQRIGLRKWSANNCKGTLNWVTGMGKTFAALLAIEQFDKVFPKEEILIVCPTVAVIDNFKDEFFKFNKEHLLVNCRFTCYASITKEFNKSFSLVILDEVHTITTATKMQFFNLVKAKGILGLSASLTIEQKKLLRPFIPIVDVLTLQDAKREKLIADFTIINLPVYFTKAEQKLYDALTEQIDFLWQKFQMQPWKKISQRTKLIFSANQKIDISKDIVQLFPNENGIIFSLNMDFSEKVADKIGSTCVAIHSGHTKKERAQKLQLFSDPSVSIRQLSVPKIFDEGVTLPLLTYSLMLSASGKEKQLIQRAGRTLRTDVKNKHSILIRTYVAKTVEKKWIESAQKEFNVINVKDLKALTLLIKRIRNTT